MLAYVMGDASGVFVWEWTCSALLPLNLSFSECLRLVRGSIAVSVARSGTRAPLYITGCLACFLVEEHATYADACTCRSWSGSSCSHFGSYSAFTHLCLELGSRIHWRPDIRAPLPFRPHICNLVQLPLLCGGSGALQRLLCEAMLQHAAFY